MLEVVSPEISPTEQQYRHDDAPPPCNGCENFRRCGLKLLACESFSLFVSRDRYYLSASRIPLAATYKAVYG